MGGIRLMCAAPQELTHAWPGHGTTKVRLSHLVPMVAPPSGEQTIPIRVELSLMIPVLYSGIGLLSFRELPKT